MDTFHLLSCLLLCIIGICSPMHQERCHHISVPGLFLETRLSGPLDSILVESKAPRQGYSSVPRSPATLCLPCTTWPTAALLHLSAFSVPNIFGTDDSARCIDGVRQRTTWASSGTPSRIEPALRKSCQKPQRRGSANHQRIKGQQDRRAQRRAHTGRIEETALSGQGIEMAKI
ncbi:hypothetical protein BKA80DRAFT_8239 [Phyllosticta citrichinensis]